MRGFQYDVRAFNSIEMVEESGIHARDAIATHHYRALRAITRKGLSSVTSL